DTVRAMDSLDELRYPIGRFNAAAEGSRADQLETLRRLPANLRQAVGGLDDAQLDTPYREGGWSARQVVHHLADSHANSYIRVKLALTEDAPTIKAYDEAAWARLPDSRLPVEVSIPFVEAVHARLIALLEPLSDADCQRTFVHPERGVVTLAQNLAIYAWHSRHHVGHITRLRDRMGW
ncbi:MAG: putative metal-dependent hydrolase, partial [Terracidiphilus sp.]